MTQHEPTPTGLNRRGFLKSAGAAGLMIGLQLPVLGCKKAADAGAATADAEPFVPNAFVRIAPDDTVTLIIKHHEMGQGTTTGLATILADELDADLARVKTEYAPANAELYGNLVMNGMQGTGGSSSIANSWMQMRQAGATARAMLVAAAADRWSVPAGEVSVSRGVLSAGGHQARFGELAEAAAAQPVPQDVALKKPGQFVYIGKASTRRLDSQAKSTGTATYTIDVKLPGLLTAVIARPPMWGATLKSVDSEAARAVPGVVEVLEIPEGVAVVAKSMWPALKGREALKIEWDESGVAPWSSETTFAEYEKLADTAGTAAVSSEQTAPALAKAAKIIEARYRFPYLAHAPMEPQNAVAWLHEGRLETWAGHQFPTIDQPSAAQAAGLDPSQVTLNTLVSGGSFGRRANPWADFTTEAVHVAKALKDNNDMEVPVRVQWTREDDTRAGLYRPLYVHKARIALDENGAVTGWQHRIVGQSIMQAAGWLQGEVDNSSVEGIEPTPYTLPGMSVELHSPQRPVRPLWWRSVGHTHTAFVMETLMDELAEAAGEDAVAYRLARLDRAPRAAATLKLAADQAGWAQGAPAGRAYGAAVHYSFNTYVAQVAEVSLGEDGLPRVHRVVCAVDCGVAVNPDQIAAQMEGGIGFALAAALYGALDVENGRAKQSNFHDYPVLRIKEMPKVEVHIVESDEPPTGVGEPGVPPLAPAVANAMYRLGGRRVRQLPLTRAVQGAA